MKSPHSEAIDYYAALGLEKCCSVEEIKIAYRKLSMKHHPDRDGGDRSEFKEITVAFEVLSDPDRRAHYDATGTDKSPGSNLVESAVAGMLMSAFTNENKDPFELMRNQVNQSIAKHSKNHSEGKRQKQMLLKKIEKFKKHNAKTTNTNGRDFILQSLNHSVALIEKSIQECQNGMDFDKDVLKFIENLSCPPDQRISPIMYPTVTWNV